MARINYKTTSPLDAAKSLIERFPRGERFRDNALLEALRRHDATRLVEVAIFYNDVIAAIHDLRKRELQEEREKSEARLKVILDARAEARKREAQEVVDIVVDILDAHTIARADKYQSAMSAVADWLQGRDERR